MVLYHRPEVAYWAYVYAFGNGDCPWDFYQFLRFLEDDPATARYCVITNWQVDYAVHFSREVARRDV
jgi:hypothetical protein